MAGCNSSLGICVGASTLKATLITLNDQNKPIILDSKTIDHDCNPKGALQELLSIIPRSSYRYCCVTGRKFKDLLNITSVTEPEATEAALEVAISMGAKPCNVLLSLGSENFIRYDLSSDLKITRVHTSGKCASGTGAFFIQQLRRMNINIAEASTIQNSVEPFVVSGRCSVFCKSDCTHALNKGIPKDRVLAGLSQMIASKAVELLASKTDAVVGLVGGVTNNSYVVSEIERSLSSVIVLPHANMFEAIGAGILAIKCKYIAPDTITSQPRGRSYHTLPPLKDSKTLVSFQTIGRSTAKKGDECIIGLDVGSTTTKAVVLRPCDSQIIASTYLRTDGDPIGASRRCYKELENQLKDQPVNLFGLGVTGSGRYISALHAKTDAVINEIIAHATAATYFDPTVDTILEIGGQDAKYTFLVNGVPCDYAMNEACSAGTGSFIEESACESFGLNCEEIEAVAMEGTCPPNFNDQCAAFIGSDIKNASHEMSREDIIAGLVYSICMNYCNRVKGPRKIGSRVFMQGGVCYNRAVPLAMASLLKKEIIVPPEPGLMGAFGVALETARRVDLGLLERSSFDLCTLATRSVRHTKSFKCAGTSENCDRGCIINLIEIENKKYPFGGICTKYSDTVSAKASKKAHRISGTIDYVTARQDTLFDSATSSLTDSPSTKKRKRIGINGAFLTNLLFPLYHTFFTELGHEVVLPDEIDPRGFHKTHSSFCFPAQISHGMIQNLINKAPDLIFIPQVYELHVEKSVSREPAHQSTCITVQSEPFYLQSAFPEALHLFATPHIDFSQGWEHGKEPFVKLACERLGASPHHAELAYNKSLKNFRAFLARRKHIGEDALQALKDNPSDIGVVLFGRPYNAFAAEANMGIPRKFASRNVRIIPFDCLPFHSEPCIENMTWAMGQDLIRAASYIKKHPQLFGCFITNFSCGPDSFIVGYFRDIMQTKPSLTLEIDNHTADAGITTRVEAFLDIIDRYRKLEIKDAQAPSFRRAKVQTKKGRSVVIDSAGNTVPLKDSRVTLLLPSMGRLLSELTAAAFRGSGLNARPVPKPSANTLMLGKANTACKECLPLILTTGSMLECVNHKYSKDDILLYFMPTANGTCRFPQYYVFLNKLIEKKQLSNVATLTLTSENSYGGLGILNILRILKSVIVSDAMEDIRNTLRVIAKDKEYALSVFDQEWQTLIACFEHGTAKLYKSLRKTSARLASIPLKCSLHDVPKVLLAGEIYVRKDEFSSQEIVNSLAKKGIVALRSPMLEWLDYVDYWVQHIEKRKLTLTESFELNSRLLIQKRVAHKIQSILSQSGLYHKHGSSVEELIETGEHFVHRSFGGETILVIGSFFRDIMKDYHGMISVGPFACLPTRIIEAILTPESTIQGNQRLQQISDLDHLQGLVNLPFLSIECDGNTFPQLVEARLEAFSLQVRRAALLTYNQQNKSTVANG